ncbi:hypothetical protein OAO06_00220 [Candidatus Pelagibacter ubique]|nr:hypothetical protein [Candidatus Pelagibacter ubique]
MINLFFYSKLDENHRPRKIYRHKLGTKVSEDQLIFEEKSEAFTVGIGLSADDKYFFISSSDHNTSEQYYFDVNEKNPKPKLIKKRQRGILYSVNSWDGKFYNHTNENAEDFKIDISNSLEKPDWKTFIAAKDEVLIGGLTFLKNWIIRSETSDALDKLFVKNITTGIEEELIFSDETVYVPGASLMQRDKNTDEIYISYSSPKTQSRVYSYNLSTKEKRRRQLEEIEKKEKEKLQIQKQKVKEEEEQTKLKEKALKEEIKLEKERARDIKLFLRKEQALLRIEHAERQKQFLKQLQLEKQIEKFRIREIKELEKLEKISLKEKRDDYAGLQARIEKLKDKYRIIRDQKIRERVEALGVKIQGDEDRDTLLQKEKDYKIARQKIELSLESFYRSASSLVFQLNKRHITRHMSIFRCIDQRFETGEIFIKWDEAPDEEWLLLIYIKNNSPDEGIVIEDKSDPEKNLSHEFKSNEIFKASDLMVDSLTQLISRKRAKKD